MNERIRELAEQATSHMPGRPPYDGLTFDVFDKEKFAELIIKECMQQVEEQYKPVLEDEVMMKDTHWDGYVQCGVDSVVAIREHFFGIDE